MAGITLEYLQNLTAEDVKPTQANESLAKFLTDNTPIEITPEQAWAFIAGHRVWQSGPERKAELEAIRVEKAEAAEVAKAERAEKAEQRKQEKAAKDAEKARKKAEKEAAEAAGEESDDSDLDETDEEGDEESTPKPTRRKRPKKTGVSAGSF